MKIDATSVSAPSQAEPVATKGPDDEERSTGPCFLAEMNRLTGTAEEPRAGNQHSNSRAKPMAILRDDSPHIGTGESVLSEIQSADSAGNCAVPVTVPTPLEEAAVAALELEAPIEFLTFDSCDVVNPDAVGVAQKASLPAVPGSPVIFDRDRGASGTPGFSSIPRWGTKVRLFQTKNEFQGLDILTGTEHPSPSPESPQNVTAGTPTAELQPVTPGKHTSNGASLAGFTKEVSALSPESSLPIPRVSGDSTSITGERLSPVNSRDSSIGVSEPLTETVQVAGLETPEPVPEVPGPIPDPVTGEFHAPGSRGTGAGATPGTVPQTPDLRVPGVSIFQPSILSSTVATTRPPQSAGNEPAESSRTSSPVAAPREVVQATNIARVEPAIPIGGATSFDPGSSTRQTGSQSLSSESTISRTGKESRQPVPEGGGSKNTPATTPEALSDRAFAAQSMAGKDPSRNIAEGVVSQKPASVKEYTPVHYLSPAGVQAGDTSPGAQNRPVSTSPARVPEFIFQLADRLQLQIQRGENQIRIQLKPESLGLLEISALNGIDGIIGRITTESGRVREYLENNLPILHQSLQDQGLKVDRIDVVLQDAFDSRQPNTQQQPLNHSGGGRSGESSRNSPRAPRVQSHLSPEGFAADPLSRLTLGPDSTFHTIA